jgi:hypothetical protein
MADENTFGRFLLNEALPDDMHFDGPVTKKDLQRQMKSYAQRDPKGYVQTVVKLKKVGDDVATWEGLSVGLDDIQPDYTRRDPIIKDALRRVAATNSVAQKRKILNETEKKIVKLTGSHPSDMTLMAKSGGRGSIPQLMKTVSSPIAATDTHGEIEPWLITKSYAEGLNPADAWVTGAEARRGVIASTGAVVEPGSVSKVVTTNMQNLVITKADCGTSEGMMLPVSDQIEDRYLARPVAGYIRNTLITPEVANELSKKKVRQVQVRSPMTCDVDDGVCQKCMGSNEWGRDFSIGSNVGMRSAQALTEPLTQFVLNAKHGVRLAGGDTDSKALIGLEGFRVLTEVPKSFTQRAAIARKPGKVEEVKKAPQGGWHITVAGQQYYTPPRLKPTVRVGDFIEAGDALTEGVAMPDDVVQHKGIGEGRRYLSSQLTNLYRRQGVDIDRRHTELLARNAVNYVRIDQDPTDTFIPGDVVKYRDVKKVLATKGRSVPLLQAKGKSLATPTLHYTAGTLITQSVVDTLRREGVDRVEVSKGGPSFEPIMKSMIRTPLLDDDWMSRLSHRYLKKTLVEGAGFGMSTDTAGTNPVPAYIMGSHFGMGMDGKYAEDGYSPVVSYVPTDSVESVMQRGLHGNATIAEDPELLGLIAKAKGVTPEQLLASIRKTQGSYRKDVFEGPNVMFSPVPGSVELAEAHPLNKGDYTQIQIDLNALMQDQPESRAFGIELDPEGHGSTRRRFLTDEELRGLQAKTPEELWQHYADPEGEGYYAANVPHASIHATEGFIDPKYLKVAESTHTKTMPGGEQLDIWKLVQALEGRDTENIDLEALSPSRSRRSGFSPRRLEAADTEFPLVVDEEGMLLDGRHRALKLLAQGETQAPAHRATVEDVLAAMVGESGELVDMEKQAKAGFLRRALLGGGDEAFDAIKGTKLIGRWGGMDPEAFEAEKVWDWLPDATKQRLTSAGKGFFTDGKLTREGAQRFRAIEDTLPMVRKRKSSLKPDELKRLREAGVHFTDADLQAIEKARGGALSRVGRGVREGLFGEAPLRMLKQRYQTGGMLGRGGVVFGDVGLSPAVQRAWRDVADPNTRDLGAFGRLGMYGGMDVGDKALSYGLPAYSAYELATTDEKMDPTTSRGEALGELGGDVFGWGMGSPFGLVGGGALAMGITDAARRAGRAIDPPEVSKEQADQQRAWHEHARRKYMDSLRSHKFYQAASSARDLGGHAVDFGQQAYHQLQQPGQPAVPRRSNPRAATHGPLPQTGNWL